MKMKIIFIAIIVLSSFSCDKTTGADMIAKLFGKKDNIKLFWDWFIRNQNEFENIDYEKREEKLDLILDKLKTIDNGLAIELLDKNENNKDKELIISPNGDKNKFETVIKIVNNAPHIEGWKIIAFKQRAKSNFKLRYEDLVLDPSEMYFYPIRKSDTLDLIIYGNNFNKHDKKIISYYGLIMIDHLIGEYDCVMKVRYYDFQDITDAEDTNGLISLSKLPDYIDKNYKH